MIVSNALVVNPAVPAKSVAELIALARSAPGRLKFASAGVGTTPHVAGEMFRLMTNTDLVHVPYKGGAPALVDVVNGQVELMFAGLATALPHIRSGRLRVLAITEKARSRVLPELPTVAESGLSDLAKWGRIFKEAGIQPQ